MRIEGMQRIQDTFRLVLEYDRRVINSFVASTAKDVAKVWRNTPYPPQPRKSPKNAKSSKSTYKRRGWQGGIKGSYVYGKLQSGKAAGSFAYFVENTAVDHRPNRPYAGFVVGDWAGKWQAGFHKKTGWYLAMPIAESVVNRHFAELSKRIEKDLAKA